MRNNVTRVKMNGMEQLLIDLKPKRNEGDVFLKTPVDVTNLVEYINKAKKEGKDYTYFHAFLLALAKTIYNRPRLNRFIQNRHMFEHNDVVIAFVAKVAFDDIFIKSSDKEIPFLFNSFSTSVFSVG